MQSHTVEFKHIGVGLFSDHFCMGKSLTRFMAVIAQGVPHHAGPQQWAGSSLGGQYCG